MSQPLVTFALFAYKQERFIREAVEGALAQRYSPLEIILSDDCSPDGTYEIMEQMAEAYAGPHKLVLNRNRQNLGLGGHVNAVMEMARGELIIMAAGDDVSLPERTTVLTEAWVREERPAGIASGIIAMDQNGERMEAHTDIILPRGHKGGVMPPPALVRLFLEHTRIGLLGCSAAWSKENWNLFGKIREGVMHEDVILSFRGFLIGGLYTVNQSLVKYRSHSQSTSFTGRGQRADLSLSFYKWQALQMMHNESWRPPTSINVIGDIRTATEKLGLSPISLAELESLIEGHIAALPIHQKWWTLGFFGRLRYWNSSPYVSRAQRVASLFGLNGYVLIRYLLGWLRYASLEGTRAALAGWRKTGTGDPKNEPDEQLPG
ncbi:MAG: glycosyltransferase [Verrucomicrobiota bacterium]|jgi:glycosyltransferase involved in cell wall biosynthesis